MSEWRLAVESLPEDGEIVLASYAVTSTYGGGFNRTRTEYKVTTLYRAKGHGWCSPGAPGYTGFAYEVLAWQPFPTPYKPDAA